MAVSARHTVAIVGGGVAGCALALALAQRGIEDVAVFEAGTAPRVFRIGETLPPIAGPALRRLGLWDAFADQAHVVSVGSRASWGKPTLGYNDFLFDPHGHGWHLDRAAFDRLLIDRVVARNIPFWRGHHLRQLGKEPMGGYRLDFETAAGMARRVVAEFLVDATGVAAGAARRLGVARNPVDSLIFVFATLDLADPMAVTSHSFLEGAEYGWWYAAKLPDAKLLLALATDAERLAERQLRNPEHWLAALRQTRHISGLADQGQPFPITLDTAVAESAILSRVVGPRWLAVGDAASSYDPLTAQGLCKALADGEAAAEAIAGCLFGDDEAPLLAYQEGVFARFTAYLRLRHYLYGQERRWSEAGFWRERPLTGR